MVLTRESCPICGHAQSTLFLKCRDFTVSNEHFNIVSCNGCGFKYTNPVPHPSVIGRYYKSEEYISHSSTRRGVIARMYHFVRRLTLRKKLRLVEDLSPKGSLLDFGCGTGNFLKVCASAGWKVVGIEPDLDARKRVTDGILVFNSVSEMKVSAENLPFNVITMWHVLEHVFELTETLKFFRDNLASEGCLVVAVPNYRSRDAAKYGAFWAAYDVPRHLYHFDREAVARLAKLAGFRVEKVLPMKFDSYYVSMLSEKYKSAGLFGLLRAVFAGLFSNLSAARTGEYSSLIYILRKE